MSLSDEELDLIRKMGFDEEVEVEMKGGLSPEKVHKLLNADWYIVYRSDPVEVIAVCNSLAIAEEICNSQPDSVLISGAWNYLYPIRDEE
jgi:hypothetical protein